MTPFTRLAVLALVACAHAQYSEERAPRYIASEPKVASTPVPILKQINRLLPFAMTTSGYPVRSSFFDHLAKIENLIREDDDLEVRELTGHNEDGSYTYGYEAADGSFKIETKSPAGDVKGKYGYKDDTGKVRVIEYGADKYGFQPAGEGITVAPPTLVDETKEERQRQENRQQPQQSRRNQYQSAPAQAIDYDYNDDIPAPAPPAPRPPQRPQQQYRPQPAPQQQYRPQPAPQQQYRAPQQTRQQQQFGVPAPTPAPYRPPQQSPTPPKPAFFPGAAPVPAQDNFFNPEPAPQRRNYQQPQNKPQAYRPAPVNFGPSDFTDAAPSHDQFSSSQFAPQPPRRANQNQPYSMLDELLKEYGLPKNGAAPLHDITFGSY